MTAITLEEATDMLCSMFDKWDRETLLEILQGNNFHLERTIESILLMEGDTTDPTLGVTPTPPKYFLKINITFNHKLI
jgi:hypothetical protein